MTDSSSDPEKRFLGALGYQFRDRNLLLEALTHPSFVNEVAHATTAHNERLEFLGDAVIDLVVSDELMRRHPNAREGALSRIRAAVVQEGGLAAVARQIELGLALRLGRGENQSGGRNRDSLLADAFEAVIAAIYLDGGLEAARRVLLQHLNLEDTSLLTASDAKSSLQERIQAKRKLTPRYRLVTEEGSLQTPVFVVEAYLESGETLGRGSGRSKKLAEQAAAAAALDALTTGEAPAAAIGEAPAAAAGEAPAAAAGEAPAAATGEAPAAAAGEAPESPQATRAASAQTSEAHPEALAEPKND